MRVAPRAIDNLTRIARFPAGGCTKLEWGDIAFGTRQDLLFNRKSHAETPVLTADELRKPLYQDNVTSFQTGIGNE